MYKQVTAGNIQDLQNKMRGRGNCNIYIKPTVDMQIEKMSIEDYNTLVEDLKSRNITLILESKDGKVEENIFRKVIVEQDKPILFKKSMENG